MRKSKILFLLLALTFIVSSIFVIGAAATEEKGEQAAPYEYVAVIGVDALGTFGSQTDTPNIDAIFADGAISYSALVENPSASAQGWGSLLIGVSADVHGLTNYSIMEGAYSNDELPTIFKLLKEQDSDAKMVSYCSWNSINNGIIENIDGLEKKAVGDANMASAISNYFTENGAPNLLFCQFNNLDAVGHNTGYGTPEFLSALEDIDSYIGDIYNIYRDAGVLDKTLFIVTGDHGGINTTHGGWSPEEKYVFYGVAGNGVNQTDALDIDFIRDTPAIVCHALGIEGTEGWDSYVPENLFVDGENILKRPPSAPELIYPNETPSVEDEKYIGNYISVDELLAGFFFDGDLSNFVAESDVELGRYVGAYSEKNVGTIYYPSGLYSQGVRVSYEGYLATEDLNLDNNSFSIGLWLSLDPMSSAQLAWSTKRWTDADGVGNFEQQGILIRNVYNDSNTYLGFNMGSGNYSVDGVSKTPASTNYYYDAKNQYTAKEWVHTLMVVDRDAKVINYYVNFELAKTIDLSKQAWFTDDYDIDPHGVFMLGQDITGVYSTSLEGTLDDLLIWNKAIDTDTVSSLKSYYTDAFYDYDYSVGAESESSATSSSEVGVSSGMTNTDNTPYTKFEAAGLGEVLTETAQYQISNSLTLSDYDDAKFYIVDFDISTASNYLPMNFVSIISGDKGTASLETPYNRITADGVLVGTLNGIKVTRTLDTSPFNWQHITLVYDLVGGDDGYPLYVYYNGDLISNAEWMSESARANGEVPSSIECTRLLVEEFATNGNYYATTLIANATSGLYVDDEYGNLVAFFTSGAAMHEVNTIFDLVYSQNYTFPVSDYIFSSNGVGYREFSSALASGNGTIDVLHNNYYTTYTVTDPCTVNTNGYHFNYQLNVAINASESTDAHGNKVHTFEAEQPLYTVTASNGSVRNYYAATSLNEIITAAASGSTIELFADVDVTADLEIYSKVLNIDLNGYTVSNSAGYIRLYSGTTLNIYDGKILDSNAKDFIYMGNSSTGATANITNCVITADKTFAEARSGVLNLTDCTYTHTGNFLRFANCTSGGYAGDKATVKIDGCTMNLGSALLISAERASSYPQAASLNVTINDSEIKTTGNLFHLKNTTSGAADSVTEITVTGESKLAFGTFDGGGATVPNTTVTFALGVRFSAEPTVNGATIEFSDGGEQITKTDDESYPYAVTKSESALYTVTTSAGAVTKYYEEMSLQALIALAPSGSTITLYSDIELTADLEINNKIYNIDLNEYTVSNTGGYIRLYPQTVFSVYDGKIVDSNAKEFIYMGNGATGAVANITNCTITADKHFAEVRAGELNLTDCSYTHAGTFTRLANCASGSNEGDKSIVNIDGCTINLGSALLISAERAPNYPVATNIKITVNDSEIKTTGNLFHLKNTTSGAADSVTEITVTGESKLAFGTFDGGGATVPNTTVTFALGVRFSAEPTVNGATIEFSDGGEGITKSDGVNYPYVVSKDDSVLYSVTTLEGAVTKYYEEMGLQELIGLAPTGSTITLYADIDLSHTTETYVTKTLVIDLNGHQITNTGERLRIQGAGNLTLKNGTLNDCGDDSGASYKDKDFINIPNGASNAVVVIDNCDIIANGFVIDIKAGSVTVKNSTYKQGGKKASVFTHMLAAGTSASLTVEGCNIDLGSSGFVTLNRASSYATEAHATVTVKDTVIKTSGNLFAMTNTVSAAASSNIIRFTGSTCLTFASLDGGTCTVDNTTVSLGKGVKLSAMPTLAKGTVAFTDGGKIIAETGDAEYPYEVTDGELTYTVTKSNGSVIKLYKEMSFGELVALADSGSVIELFSDVTVTSALTILNQNIEVDLNGYTITSSVRTRVEGTTALYIRGGNIVDGNADFVFIPGGHNSASFKIENCNVQISGKLIDARGGKIEVIDSDFKNTAGTAFLLSSQGTSTTFVASGCTFDLGTASIISTSRGNYTDAAYTNISIHNCTVNTTGSMFYLINEYTADISKIEISITGDETKLSYGSFDGGSCSVPDTVATIGLGVKMNMLPTISSGSIVLGDGGNGISASGDDEYPYIVSDKSSIPVKAYFSLTLYSDFTLNLCFRESDKDSIIKVICGNTEIEPIISNGMVLYPIKDIAAYNAAEIKDIKVVYSYESITLETILKYSVIDYANTLLASNYSLESKNMLCRTIDYIKASYEYVGLDVPKSVTDIIASDAYNAISTDGNVTEIPSSSADIGNINKVFETSQIDLTSELRFRFNIKSGVTSNITVKTRTYTETFEIVDGMCDGKTYILVKMRAFDMYDGLITFSTDNAVGTYDLKAYANSYSNEKGENDMVYTLLLSLYNYCKSANEYSKVQDKDFRSFASVVLKDGKSGTVTYVVDDGRADTAQRLEPMLDEYDNLKLTFALIATKYATLQTVYNEQIGKYEYVRDENGRYVYTVNEEAAAYWRELIKNYNGRVEYSNHSFTHGFAGYDDEGGTVSYVDTSGNIRTVILPVGSATAELYAAIQVFQDLFGAEVETLVQPGVAANRSDVVIDGVTYPGYLAYYFEVVERMYAEGILVGSRGDGFGEANMSEKFLVTPENFGDVNNRLNITSYTAKDIDSIDSWKKYIDYAVESGGWANFCLHQIFPDGTVSSAFHLKESQARELFSYTNRDDVWVANYAEAAKYYAEWSTADVRSEYSNGIITVSLTDKENNDVFDEALTVKVSVPTSWTKCIINGQTLTKIMVEESGEHYVYVNIIPDSNEIILSNK